MVLYKGPSETTTPMMFWISLQLQRKNLHYPPNLPLEINLSPHRTAELTIIKIIQDDRKMNTLVSLNALFLDEIGQVLAEIVSFMDMIIRELRNNNIFIDGIIIIFTIDHNELKPAK